MFLLLLETIRVQFGRGNLTVEIVAPGVAAPSMMGLHADLGSRWFADTRDLRTLSRSMGRSPLAREPACIVSRVQLEHDAHERLTL